MGNKEISVNPEYEKLIPPMTKVEYNALKKSIKQHGLLTPIEVNADNVILEGHHRFKACKELGVDIRTVTRTYATKEDEKKHVLITNLERRHLNDFQKIEIGMRLLEVEKELARHRHGVKSASNEADFGKATAIVAKKIGVSRTTFERAKTIIEKGSEELKKKARNGSISISRGYQKVRVPTETKLKIPTKVLNQTKTNTVDCDFHLHHYVGCSHGCLYCYCEWMSFVKHRTWLKAFPVPDATKILQRDIENLKKKKIDPKGVMVSSSTDPYQPLNDKHNLTRACLEILMKEDYRIVILTKNKRILNDIDLFKGYDNVICGITITSLDDYVRRKLESGASKSSELIEALKTLHDKEIKTYCSIEPVLVGVNPIETLEKVKDFVDVLEFGRRTPFEKGFDLYYSLVFKDIITYCKKHEINYGIANHSRAFCERYKIPFKTCV